MEISKNEDAPIFWGPVSFKSLVSRCGETNLQVPQGRLSFGRGSSAGCEDDFEGYKGWAFSGAGGAGRSETESEGSLDDLPNSMVAVGAAMEDVDIAGACGEHDLGGHVVEFENLQPAALLNLGICIVLIQGIRICHPSMHAPSLARVIDGTSGRVCGTGSGEGIGSVLRGWDTARLDVSLHDVIRPVPACCFPRTQGLPEFHNCSYARESTSSNSRWCVGLNLGEKQSCRGGVLCARSGGMFGKSLLFLSSCQKGCMSRRTPVGVRTSETFPGIRNSREGVLWLRSLLGLRVSLLCYLGQVVTLG